MRAPMYNAKGEFGGCALFTINSDGEPEMSGFEPAPKCLRAATPKSPMDQLFSVLLSHFKKREITEVDWAYGFKVQPNGERWTALIAYVTQDGRYSLYEAVPNLAKGIDIENEKELCIGPLSDVEICIHKYIDNTR